MQDDLHHHPDLGPLLAANDFRAASEAARNGPAAERARVEDLAVQHWLAEADAAQTNSDRTRMNACLAEAARFRRPDHAPLFREARRRMRARTLELTAAPHWVDLVHAAAYQREHYFHGARPPLPDTYRTFENPRLLASVGPLAADPAALDTVDPSPHSDRIAACFPTDLRDGIARLGAPFLRAHLALAAARPDLAVLDLLELPDHEPLVCLERARVAYALGFPATAATAIADFVRLHGEHVVLRRLHTGVFQAQMALAAGDPEQAVALLSDLPLDAIGRRPVLLLVRLLRETGAVDRAEAVLAEWCAAHPDDEEARALRG
jgi:hypothetical protein